MWVFLDPRGFGNEFNSQGDREPFQFNLPNRGERTARTEHPNPVCGDSPTGAGIIVTRRLSVGLVSEAPGDWWPWWVVDYGGVLHENAAYLRVSWVELHRVSKDALARCLRSGWGQGCALTNLRLCATDLRGANLRDALLHCAELHHCDLSDANMERAFVVRANLSNATLRNTNLRKSDLRGVNLDGADLHDANMVRADLRDASLIGADLSGTIMTEVNLCGANLTGARLNGAHLRKASLWMADLSGTDLSGARLDGVIWCCKMSRAAQWSPDVSAGPVS